MEAGRKDCLKCCWGQLRTRGRKGSVSAGWGACQIRETCEVSGECSGGDDQERTGEMDLERQ